MKKAILIGFSVSLFLIALVVTGHFVQNKYGSIQRETASVSNKFFSKMKMPTNANLQELINSFSKISSKFNGSVKVVNLDNPKNRTREAFYLAKIKQVMHIYMCNFFDESINLSHPKKIQDVLSHLEGVNNFENTGIKLNYFRRALTSVLSDKTLDIYSGTANGNNTFGEVMGIYDSENNEVVYLGFTNCGSDN